MIGLSWEKSVRISVCGHLNKVAPRGKIVDASTPPVISFLSVEAPHGRELPAGNSMGGYG